MKKEGHIDLEKISNSIETLSSVENIVNLVDLAENFEDMEKYFRQVNFEHSNCIEYKEPLSIIYSDLDLIKKKINELVEALKRTKYNYTNINSFSDHDIKEFTEIYKSTPASEDLSKLVGTKNTFSLSELSAQLPTQDKDIQKIPLPDTAPATEQEPINTVPIGVAIGATGIAGSIGAVIVDDIYSKRDKYRKVKRDEVYLDEYIDDTIPDDGDYSANQEKKEIAQGPYRAARLEREADRFYGNQLDKMEINDDDYIYVDEDDLEDDDEFE